MKMVNAIIRPESTQQVIEALEKHGIYAMTSMNVLGRGKEMGIMSGSVRYSELPKEMLMIVVDNDKLALTVSIIKTYARTGDDSAQQGRIGDGKIFVTDMDEAITIRTTGQQPGSRAT